MNRSFLIVLIPATLVAIAYFLMAAYAGVKLSYPRIVGAAVGFAIAVYLVHRYEQRKRARRAQINASH